MVDVSTLHATRVPPLQATVLTVWSLAVVIWQTLGQICVLECD